MQFHTIKRKTANKKPARVGRGGKRGKTAGRGTKGQNARAGRKKRPEIRDTIKRYPKLRGRGISPLKSIKGKAIAINLSTLDKFFDNGETVNAQSVGQKGIITSKKGLSSRIKILGAGELTKKLKFSGVEVSESAMEKIKTAGGEIAL